MKLGLSAFMTVLALLVAPVANNAKTVINALNPSFILQPSQRYHTA